MTSSKIRIYWGAHSTEYIDIDFDSLEKLKSESPVKWCIESTEEWWPRTKELVQYSTRSKAKRCHDGSIELDIIYDHNQNQHIPFEYVLWGTSTIKLTPPFAAGTAFWHGEDPREARWKRISTGLLTDIKRVTVSRLAREEQAIFRARLLARDKCCFLSKERTVESLEAAHIIPHEHRGAPVNANGLLLRADLHNLYDAEIFSIDPSGRVVVADDRRISKAYRDLLHEARLPARTLSDVRSALEQLVEYKTNGWPKTKKSDTAAARPKLA